MNLIQKISLLGVGFFLTFAALGLDLELSPSPFIKPHSNIVYIEALGNTGTIEQKCTGVLTSQTEVITVPTCVLLNNRNLQSVKYKTIRILHPETLETIQTRIAKRVFSKPKEKHVRITIDPFEIKVKAKGKIQSEQLDLAEVIKKLYGGETCAWYETTQTSATLRTKKARSDGFCQNVPKGTPSFKYQNLTIYLHSLTELPRDIRF